MMSDSEEIVILTIDEDGSSSDGCSVTATWEDFVIIPNGDDERNSGTCCTATRSQDWPIQLRYNYESLREGDVIRYLILDSGQGTEPLRGRLRADYLECVPAFDAISYTWGSHEKTGHIECDGKRIGLTENLKNALFRVRLPTRSRYLWVDQICINQDDPAERGSQVALMGKIFTTSRITWIWLGPCDGRLAQELRCLIDEVYDVLKAQIKKHGSFQNLPVIRSSDPIVGDPRWNSLAVMTDHAWFHRVWVVQEAGLALCPILIYGNYEFDWEKTMAVLRWLNQQGTAILERFKFRPNPIHMERLRIWQKGETENENLQFYGGLEQWPLLRILHFSRQLQASDPRDHVYAFLGHPSARHPRTGKPIIIPDYTKGLSQVTLDFALQYLKWTQDINLLSYVQHKDETCLEDSVSSWVPQWQCLLGNVLGYDGENMYAAGAQSSTSPQFIESCQGLKVGVVIFDTVQYQSRIFTPRNTPPSMHSRQDGIETQESNLMIDLWNYLSGPESPCTYTDHLRLRAFVHTLVAGFTSTTPLQAKANCTAYLHRVLPDIESSPYYISSSYKGDAASGIAEAFENDARYQGLSRRFIVTQRGHYGLAPLIAHEGDICCVVRGARVPLLIRETRFPGHYKLLGEAYIHGTMHGQTVDLCRKGELREGHVILV